MAPTLSSPLHFPFAPNWWISAHRWLCQHWWHADCQKNTFYWPFTIVAKFNSIRNSYNFFLARPFLDGILCVATANISHWPGLYCRASVTDPTAGLWHTFGSRLNKFFWCRNLWSVRMCTYLFWSVGRNRRCLNCFSFSALLDFCWLLSIWATHQVEWLGGRPWTTRVVHHVYTERARG